MLERLGAQGQRLVRFLLVGGFFAALNLLLLHWWVKVLGVPYLWAVLAAFVLLNFLSYGLNKVFTFGLPRQVCPKELLRYYLVTGFSLACNLALMVLLVSGLGLDVLAASLMVSVALALLNFHLHAQVSFQLPSQGADAARLRVLQVSAFFPAHGGGIEVVAGQLASRLVGQGLDVTWMAGGKADECPAAGSTPARVIRATSVDVIEPWLGLPMPLWGPLSLVRLWREVARCDLVQVHDYLYVHSLLTLFFAVLMNRPLVLTQHIGSIELHSAAASAVLSALNRSLGRWALTVSDQVVFVGRPVMQYFAGFVRFHRPAMLVANGVDHHTYVPVPKAPVQGRRLRVLFVGRFVDKKGISLLQGCVDLPDTEWRFVGWGPLSPRQWALPAAAKVEVLEGLRAQDVVPCYQWADLLVLPSHGEGFPLVLQEALACGTPVLVSAEVAQAFPSLDSRCVHAVELRSGEPGAALRQRLQQVLSDPERLASAAAHAAALSRQWSWASCVTAYGRVYHELATVPRRSA
jgi:glycosyltransferase involved in cell wall biosynthesis/putative flippase GtrA